MVLRGAQHTVFVQSAPGVFEPRDVRLSYQDSKQAVVARGMEAGDKVVSENVLLLARQFALSRDPAEAKPAALETDGKAAPTATEAPKKP